MTSLCWLRRDLRLHDNAAFFNALAQGETHLAFIFDSHILDQLKDKNDRRVTFIIQSLEEIERKLEAKGSSLHILYGRPEEEIPKLALKLKVNAVFCNRDYEPYAKERDQKVEKKLRAQKVDFHQLKDQVIFEKEEIITGSGGLYKVFTPYKNKWLEKFEQQDRILPNYQCRPKNLARFANPQSIFKVDWYKIISFNEALPPITGGSGVALKRLKHFKMDHYEELRHFPARNGTSLLSPYLRFGNISVRDMVRAASSSTWLNELIWREFYQMILDAFPRVQRGAYKEEYNQIKWLGDPKHFELWCQGQTGFPLVDAAMRCLNKTGLMHNRLRMVTASFLCKTLLIDWRKGEQYFARKLLDFDLAANNGGWQWCASTGTDAQPYFRIFNPYTQSEKFDPDGIFIREWCPELASLSNKEIHRGLNSPIVNYSTNRIRCLEMYSKVKKA